MAIFFIFLLPYLSGAGYAPEKGPTLPDGWCAEGTITRSTGECMCSGACEGPQCRSGQGLIWYSYKDCPRDCKCVATSNVGNVARAVDSTTGGALPQCAEDKDTPCDDEDDTAADEETPKSWSDDDGEDDSQPTLPSEEEDLSTAQLLMELIDENGRLIFGLVIILIVSCALAPIFMLSVGSLKNSANSSTEPRKPDEQENENTGSSVSSSEPSESLLPESKAENESSDSSNGKSEKGGESNTPVMKLAAPAKRPTGRPPSKKTS